MYPDWPESDDDLIPLPECPGPKLKPFDFQGPQKIEFLGIAGEGTHAIVIKVKILGQIYALKVVSLLSPVCTFSTLRSNQSSLVPILLGPQLDRSRGLHKPFQSRTHERSLRLPRAI